MTAPAIHDAPRMRLAILRCRELAAFTAGDFDIPPDEELFADELRLIAELARLGADGDLVRWGEEGIDWSTYDLALIRSTWDYIDQRERFLAALETIETVCPVLNPLDVVRWNSDKHYLFDLLRWGVPIVPTVAVSTDEPSHAQQEALARGWTRVVLKPRVGAGAMDVRLVDAVDVDATLRSLQGGGEARGFLMQPLVETITVEGEWSFVFVDGRYRYALLKKPAAGDFRAHFLYDGTTARVDPSAADIAEAEAIVARLPFDLLYARLDIVRVDGRLAIMELELIEPMLYFELAPEGATELARAAIERVRGEGRSSAAPRS